MEKETRYRVIGLMSGTSLDGLDIVHVTLSCDKTWQFELHHASTYPYDDAYVKKIQSAFHISGDELVALSVQTGRMYAEMVNHFLQKNKIPASEIDFIASHGQTIFHQPQKGYTLQIGNGPELAINTGIPTINDFRSKDVALGGNGAPLIPVADFLLFEKYAEAFVNIGGFSNLSYKKGETIHSFDICPANIVLNHLINVIGKKFDEGGKHGKKGQINAELLHQLYQLPFYHEKGPKSLGWEWVEASILPLFKDTISLSDQLRTYYEHCAFQIGVTINKLKLSTLLITGGGAKNDFLIERIRAHTSADIIIPNEEIIDYKEAIGFAFLGVLRWENQNNVWASVTGAKKDSCCGTIIYP